MKMVAFNLAKQSNQPGILKMMITIYELVQDNEMFLPKLREMIAVANYKDVSRNRLRSMPFFFFIFSRNRMSLHLINLSKCLN